jgi:MFS family permease
VSDEELRIDRSLKLSIFEGSLHAVMLGAAESYLGALAVELGHGPINQAVLATVPLALAAFAQLTSSVLARKWGRKQVTIAGAAAQGLAMGSLGLIAILEARDLWSFLAAKCAFFVAGGVLTPTWNSWITALTANVDRQRYFGVRSAVNQVCVLFSFLGAGQLLHRSHGGLGTFAVLCSIGLLARLGSSIALVSHADVAEAPVSLPHLSAIARCVEAVRKSNFKVATYMAFMMFGATISTPFFTPYMLRELNMDYGTFTWLSATSVLVKALLFPVYHRVAAKVGLARLLVLAGVGVSMVPIFWALGTNYVWLLITHLLSGAAWAALEFASFQLMMRETHAEYRTEFFSLANSLSGVLQVTGSWIGGVLLRDNVLAYRELFALSGVLRMVPLSVLVFQLPRLPIPKRLFRVPTRSVSVRPSAGTVERPILPAVSNGSRSDDSD